MEHSVWGLSFEQAEEEVPSMKNDKISYPDGLSAQFYEKLFHLFGREFIDIIIWGKGGGEWGLVVGGLTASQRQNVITLLCRDRDYPFLLKMCGLISPLNLDHKILSKSLTLHLRKALLFIVQQDQTCSVPAFQTMYVCTPVQKRLWFCKTDGIKLHMLIFRSGIYKLFIKSLIILGFGPMFISLIKLLYTDIRLCYCWWSHWLERSGPRLTKT